MHQIVWVVQWPAVCSGFWIAAGRAFGFRGNDILTDEINEIDFCDPSLTGIPRWCPEAGHRLAPGRLRSVRAEDPVDGG